MADADSLKIADRYLKKDPLLHVDMLEMLRFGRGELVAATDRGVIMSTPHPNGYAISSDDPDTASKLLRLVGRASLFIAHQSYYLDQIQGRFGLDGAMPCFQSAYFGKQPIPQNGHDLKIEVLGAEHIDFVLEHYALFHDRNVMLHHLQSDSMFGAWTGGQLAAFIGVHETGALGMLEVLPDFRRHGIGEALQIYMTNRLLAQGFTPFAQIQVDNRASIALQRKLGYELTESNVIYCYTR